MKTLKTVQATAPPNIVATTTAANGHAAIGVQGQDAQTANENGADGG